MNRPFSAVWIGGLFFVFGCSSSNADKGSTSSSAGSSTSSSSDSAGTTAGTMGTTAGMVGDNGGGVLVTTGSLGGTSSTTTSGGMNSGTTCNGKLVGLIRDFHTAFPDMEIDKHDSTKCAPVVVPGCDDRGMVADMLGSDLKPVYAGNPDTGTKTTTGKANFDQWFRDTDQNTSMTLPLQFTDDDHDGVYSYVNYQFFPIDGQMFGNEDDDHNFHFTFELHTKFKYKGGETFRFIGDDDVFTFIDGKLVVDLGGVHVAEQKDVNLDDLGLEVGQTYSLDFFYAERHVDKSEFEMDTSLNFIDCGVH